MVIMTKMIDRGYGSSFLEMTKIEGMITTIENALTWDYNRKRSCQDNNSNKNKLQKCQTWDTKCHIITILLWMLTDNEMNMCNQSRIPNRTIHPINYADKTKPNGRHKQW